MMSNIDNILAFNREYVASKGYEKHITDKYPDKKLAILSCMDTRLSVLLPEALGLQNGDAKIIKFPTSGRRCLRGAFRRANYPAPM